MDIIPKPNNQPHIRQGNFTLPDRMVVDIDSFEPYCLAAFANRCGLALEPENEKKPSWLRLNRNDNLPREGYSLTVTEDGINIEAATETGVIWALTTISETLKKNRSLPCISLEDSPRYNHRGLMLDCVRQFFDVDQVKQIIEQISRAKINTLHWHLTDDQGWRIESTRFPLLQSKGGEFYTQKEIRDVVAFAHERGVEIIPEIDLPGHTTGLLAAYPQFSCSGTEVEYATGGGIYKIILCPAKERTFEFLDSLLEEICELFPSPYFHIGGDEAPKTEWKKCADCLRKMEELKLHDWDDLQGYFSSRVIEILRKSNKRAVLWNDALRASSLPVDMTVQYWNPQFSKALRRHINNGGDFVYSNMFELYLDYPHAMTSLKKIYNVTPKIDKKDWTNKSGLSGLQACMWTEHVKNNNKLEKQIFPRIFAMAEIAWSRDRNYKDFIRRLSIKVNELTESGTAYTPIEECNPKGKIRRDEAVRYLTSITANMSPEVRKDTIEATAPNFKFILMTLTKFFKLTDLPFLLKSLRN